MENYQYEMVGVKIKKLCTLSICVYTPPESGCESTFNEYIDTLQITINGNSDLKRVIVCGDLISL